MKTRSIILIAIVLVCCVVSYVAWHSYSGPQKLSMFFEEYSSCTDKTWVAWVERSKIKIPIIHEEGNEYVNVWDSFFSVGHAVLGYTDAWELHLLWRTGIRTITHEVIIPVNRYDSLPEDFRINHFGEIIFEQESLLRKLMDEIELQPVNLYEYPKVKREVCDDFGYCGLFDTVHDLAYHITLGEYTIK